MLPPLLLCMFLTFLRIAPNLNLKMKTFNIVFEKIRWFFGLFPLKFLGRAVLAVFLACYAYAGVSSLVVLTGIELHKRQDISRLADILRVAGDDAAVVEWMRFRPLSDTEAMVAMITPEAARLPPTVFFEIARRHVSLKNGEEGLFWLQLGRFRLRYDVLRCGAQDSVIPMEKAMLAMTPPALTSLLHDKPDLLKKSIRRVLEFDAKHPAANDPQWICKTVEGIERVEIAPPPPASWEKTRNTLRQSAEEFLQKE